MKTTYKFQAQMAREPEKVFAEQNCLQSMSEFP